MAVATKSKSKNGNAVANTNKATNSDNVVNGNFGGADEAEVNQSQTQELSTDVIVPRMTRSKQEKTIKQLLKMKSKIRFDLAIQRNNVWTKEQKSMLIHSILEEYPIPLLFVKKSEDGVLWMLDGKQRLGGAIFDYIDGEYALAKGTPPVWSEVEVSIPSEIEGEAPQTVVVTKMVDVVGKFFSGLPEDLKEQILGYSLSIIEMSNITPDQIEELFQRLNAGSPLTKMELTRALAGAETMDFINKIAEMKFFDEYTEISVNGRNHFIDQEMIMAIVMTSLGSTTGFTSKDIREFAIALRGVGIDNETKEQIVKTSEYLEEAFTNFTQEESTTENKKIRSTILKKAHTPMLFHVAQTIAIPLEINAKDFGAWAVEFFVTNYKAKHHGYSKHAAGGSAKVGAVRGRREYLTNNFVQSFQITPEQLIEIGAIEPQEQEQEQEFQGGE